MLKLLSFIALLLYFAVLLFIVIKDKKNKNTLDYFFAGRTFPFWALSITFVASWWGAGSAIETADSAFKEGLGAFWIYGMPVLMSTFLMILGGAFIRRTGYLTQSEMMKKRYSVVAAKMIAIMILLFMVFNVAVQMVGIGNLFGSYLGISYEYGILLGASIVIIYSMFGGFRGVVITDLIQFFLLLFSAIAVLVVAIMHSGGIDHIREVAQAKNMSDFFSFTAGAEKNFIFIITFGFSWAIQANIWQRLSATRSSKDTTKMATMSFFVYIPLYLIVVFTGMAALGMYEEFPKNGIIASIVTEYMHPVLGAMVFLGLSAAIMSTMDSLINTGAMTIGMDLTKENLSEKSKLKISIIATLLISLVGIFISIWVRSILELSFIASDIITSGVFIPLLLGFFWKRGTAAGAISSMIFGIIYSFYNFFVVLGVKLPIFWEVKSANQAIIGIALSAVIYVVASLLTKPEYEKAESFLKGRED